MVIKRELFRTDSILHSSRHLRVLKRRSFTKEDVIMERKLPVGIQGFEKLRTEGFVYVDKTKHIYQLAHHNIPYFLSPLTLFPPSPK